MAQPRESAAVGQIAGEAAALRLPLLPGTARLEDAAFLPGVGWLTNPECAAPSLVGSDRGVTCDAAGTGDGPGEGGGSDRPAAFGKAGPVGVGATGGFVGRTGGTGFDSRISTSGTGEAGGFDLDFPSACLRVGSIHSGACQTTLPRSAAGAIPPWPPSGRALSPIVRRSDGEGPWITICAVQGTPPGASGSICRTISLGPASRNCFLDFKNGTPATDTLDRWGRTTRRRISSFRPVGSEPRSMSSGGNDQVHIGGGSFPEESIDQRCNQKKHQLSASQRFNTLHRGRQLSTSTASQIGRIQRDSDDDVVIDPGDPYPPHLIPLLESPFPIQMASEMCQRVEKK